MIGRGARGTPEEFATVIDFLSEGYGLRGIAGPHGGRVRTTNRSWIPRRSELGRTPSTRQDCLACHGTDARGTPTGPNLVRSLHRAARSLRQHVGPYLRTSHPPARRQGTTPSSRPSRIRRCSSSRISCASSVNDTLRGAPMFKPGNVLDGRSPRRAPRISTATAAARSATRRPAISRASARASSRSTSSSGCCFPRRGAPRRRRTRRVVTVTVTTESGETLSGPLETDGRLQRVVP